MSNQNQTPNLKGSSKNHLLLSTPEANQNGSFVHGTPDNLQENEEKRAK